LKHTAIDHRDYNNLSQAFSQVKQAVQTIEVSTQEVQAMEKTKYIMENLVLKKMVVQPNPARRWLRDGGVRVLSARKANKEKKRWLILFNGMVPPFLPILYALGRPAAVHGTGGQEGA